METCFRRFDRTKRHVWFVDDLLSRWLIMIHVRSRIMRQQYCSYRTRDTSTCTPTLCEGVSIRVRPRRLRNVRFYVGETTSFGNIYFPGVLFSPRSCRRFSLNVLVQQRYVLSEKLQYGNKKGPPPSAVFADERIFAHVCSLSIDTHA